MKKTKTKVKMNKAVYSGMSVLNISKTLMYKSLLITLNQGMGIEQIYVIWVLIALLFIL